MDGFTALADPTRRQILDMLLARARDAGSIAAEFPVSRPAISRHLRVLREAGLVDSTVQAQRRVYSVRPDGLEEIDRWVARYRRLWSTHLDRLEEALRAETDLSNETPRKGRTT